MQQVLLWKLDNFRNWIKNKTENRNQKNKQKSENKKRKRVKQKMSLKSKLKSPQIYTTDSIRRIYGLSGSLKSSSSFRSHDKHEAFKVAAKAIYAIKKVQNVKWDDTESVYEWLDGKESKDYIDKVIRKIPRDIGGKFSSYVAEVRGIFYRMQQSALDSDDDITQYKNTITKEVQELRKVAKSLKEFGEKVRDGYSEVYETVKNDTTGDYNHPEWRDISSAIEEQMLKFHPQGFHFTGSSIIESADVLEDAADKLTTYKKELKKRPSNFLARLFEQKHIDSLTDIGKTCTEEFIKKSESQNPYLPKYVGLNMVGFVS